MKKYITEILTEGFFSIVILCSATYMLYIVAHKGGWYCEYCNQGSIRGKYEVEHEFGNTPCEYSDDGRHHFKYYMEQPIENPEYVK